MYEVIREMKEGRINGCLYTDGWPHFSTAVTQEFTPKLSEVHIAGVKIIMKVEHG